MMKSACCTLLLGLASLLPALSAQNAAPSQAASPRQARTYFWFRMYPDLLGKYDVAADKLVGKVKNKNGVAHRTYLTHDRLHILNVTGQRTTVEVVNLAAMEVEEEHSFKRDGYIIRVDSVLEIPGGTHWYVKVDKIKSALDHFVVEKPEWLYYNIEEQTVEKKMKELPKILRRGARISPDGKMWHVFGKDITIVDPKTLKEVGKIELSRPLYTGMGAISVRGEDMLEGQDPGAYRMLYTMTDPVMTNRRLFGIVDINLEEHKIVAVRELGWNPPASTFRLTKDKKTAIGQSWGGGGRGRSSRWGERDLTLITYDLEHARKVRETRITVRNGLSLGGISPDGKKLYLTGRGHELVIYDDHHRFLKTVEMGGEVNGRLIVVEE